MSDVRFGLKESVLSKVADVFRRHPRVEEVVLYGSRAKGTQKPGSDVDLVLKGEGLNLREINRISLELDSLNLPYTFDLSLYHRIDNPELIEHIERIGQVLYRKPLS
jgi:predicted nucleotidyltransferase